ncbi:UDP-glucose 4-epimerase [Anoxybacillus vitaminiphilus]|uniref:UDP-glucose 4-epimerase n=1 Tax=Paranoxybacillus vitaminiphilus TaxID=581036 RepID=A0A327YHD0_9BACL|nr:SDR family NAD(P)-dependent oxidoreductase [Anoxybacillus vitaminiphilus]RAK20400.1 UDP-glucose 4-epimerase [Anoxybacillus vitaminiphilus]
MEKVLVTGGAGFIGSHIVDKLLEEGYEVAVFDNLSTGKLENLREKTYTFYEGDISNKEQVYAAIADFQPHYIIHQAAQVSVAKSVENMEKDARINIMGSINVINAAKDYGVKKIVYASSAAVYGEPQYLPIDENHPINPKSPYGISKFTVELYLKATHELYGIDYTILRYANVYGPRQDAKGEGGVVAIFAEKIANGETPTIFGDGKQTRDFVYVTDVAAANVLAIQGGRNKIFNISTNTMTNINYLFNLINSTFHKEMAPIYEEGRKGDIKSSVLNNISSKEALNWEPQVSIEEGIDKIAEYYKMSKIYI